MNKQIFSKGFLKITITSMLLLVGENLIHAQSRVWAVPKDASSTKNPVSSDAGSIKTGKTLYTTYCTTCHGDKGKGDGIASAALNPKPADHTSAALKAESDGSLFYKISNGRTPMPQFKTTLNDAQRWALINYIRTLAKKTK